MPEHPGRQHELGVQLDLAVKLRRDLEVSNHLAEFPGANFYFPLGLTIADWRLFHRHPHAMHAIVDCMIGSLVCFPLVTIASGPLVAFEP